MIRLKINIIAACDKNGVIGINGKLPFHIPEDLKRFKALTMGHAVIMGRKTYESLPIFPLPDRLNIIVSLGRESHIGDREYASSLHHALSKAVIRHYEQVFIIGGEQLYREALPLADRVYLTLVNQETPIADGDEVARFPLDVFNKLLEDKVFNVACTDGYNAYEFIDFVRK